METNKALPTQAPSPPQRQTQANEDDDNIKQQPSPLHQSEADEDDDNVKQLGECSSVYLSLQHCLVESNRNWKVCQKEVLALKACNERRNKQSN